MKDLSYKGRILRIQSGAAQYLLCLAGCMTTDSNVRGVNPCICERRVKTHIERRFWINNSYSEFTSRAEKWMNSLGRSE
jgi:hypothetical protein